MEPVRYRGIFKYTKRITPFLLLGLLLFTQGCDEREVYSRFMTQNLVKPNCVDLNTSAPYFEVLKSTLALEGIPYRRECSYRVVVLKSYSACAFKHGEQPVSKGVLRLEFLEGEQSLYQIQKEFLDESDSEMIGELVPLMGDEFRRFSP